MWIFVVLVIFLVLIGVVLRINDWIRQLKIYRWRSALALDKHHRIYQQIIYGIDGFKLSRLARTKIDAMEYVYGEIEFLPFIALLSLTKPNENTVFYDLGSGSGKAVIAMAIVFPVKKSCGVELFAELYAAGIEQQRRLARVPDYETAATRIDFIHDNFINTNIHDATLIYINATGFFGDIWNVLNRKLEEISTCLTVITTSKPLKSQAFTLQKITAVQMSWGVVKAYIHARG